MQQQQLTPDPWPLGNINGATAAMGGKHWQTSGADKGGLPRHCGPQNWQQQQRHLTHIINMWLCIWPTPPLLLEFLLSWYSAIPPDTPWHVAQLSLCRTNNEIQWQTITWRFYVNRSSKFGQKAAGSRVIGQTADASKIPSTFLCRINQAYGG